MFQSVLKKLIFILTFLLTGCLSIQAQSSKILIEQGWHELIKDNDTSALRYFNEALLLAQKNNDAENEATALLHLGMASYGSSLSNGLKYTNQALQAYSRCEKTNYTFAELGRSKCLILTATIKVRLGKENEAMQLCKEAIQISTINNDTSSSLGLAFNILGSIYARRNQLDTSDEYFIKALQIRLSHKEMIYLPASYIKVGDILLRNKQYDQSWIRYQKGKDIADSMQNKQSQILCLLALSNWNLVTSKNYIECNKYLLKAKALANDITDKTFLVKVLQALKELSIKENKFTEAIAIQEEIIALNEQQHDLDKVHLAKSLEVQFGLMEKERELNLIKKEQAITKLTNYLLFVALAFISIVGAGFIIFLKRINKRDKQLLQTKAELLEALNSQKKLKEQQLQNEIEFKESQLSALTLQMIQKNELMQELKEKIENNNGPIIDSSVSKIINKGLTQDKEWTDFNSHFESINKNFYTRIKQAFPEISPNELKICALIKMNLSIKEMASILNISPDSVKTARYRLRKKLNLNTEDNLTDFILNLQ